ncbi:phage tail tape measure protein [Herbidospora mongoliensis]|uniref:phage tail tape measure protein n=1 Tax=Herbidospora mongoliensis TaxID=688067 RepID=UPI00083789CE|nr:phage tail tape measure protein [Herbidospora mongoliensis]
MALTVGELVSYIDAEDIGFARTLTDAGQSMNRLESTATGATRRLEDNVAGSMSGIGQALVNGLDPTAAISDLDRLELALDDSLREMLSGADSFAPELRAAVEEAFDLDDEARRGGQRAGEAAVDGLDSVRPEARRAGDRAGDAFGDGVESSARQSGSGAADGLMSTMKGAGWAAAGAAIGAALMEGMSKALEKDALFTELAVKVGAFGPEAERLGRIAGELYAQGYGESLGEVTDALAKVLQGVDGAGKLGDDALSDMTEQAMTVAKVMDDDVSRVTAAVANMLRTDLSPSAEAAFDTLVRGQQDGINKSEDLLDTFEEYSTQFREIGLDADTALGLMSQGLKAGARDADTVGDALKEFAIRSKDGSKTSADAFKAIGLDSDKMFKIFAEGGPKAQEAMGDVIDRLRDMKDPVEQDAAAVALFGGKAEDLQDALYALDPATAVEGLGEVGGAVKAADEALSGSVANSAEQWSRGWGDALAWVGAQIMDFLMELLPDPAAAIEEFTTGWQETIVPFFSGLWEDVSTTTEEAWNGLMEWLSAVPGEVGEFFSEGWEAVSSSTAEWWGEITSSATAKADELVAGVQGIPGEVGAFFSEGWANVKSTTSEAWEGIKQAAKDKGVALIAWVTGLPPQMVSALGNVGTLLYNSGGKIIGGLLDGLRAKAGEIGGTMAGIVQQIKDYLPFSPAKTGPFSGSGNPYYSGISIMTLLGDGLLSRLPNIKSIMTSSAEAMMDSWRDGINAKRDTILDAVKVIAAQARAIMNESTMKTLQPGTSQDMYDRLQNRPTGQQPAPVNLSVVKPNDSAGSSGTTVNMYGTVFQENVDIDRFNSDVAFEVVHARGS